MKPISPIKGMHDILPEDSVYWNMIENTWSEVVGSYCYKEIRTPIVEKLDLFLSSIGTETDIVSKELFDFFDRKHNKVALRPEGTASCVRAIINNNLLYNNKFQRIWYKGCMFRYENTQKGRYRQFNQIGMEAFGFSDINIELEQLCIIKRFFKKIFLENITLEINSIGSTNTRMKYKTYLLNYLEKYKNSFSQDIKNTIKKNPLRILDSKKSEITKIISTAPLISKFYSYEEKKHLDKIESFLLDNNIKYRKNPHLVRGLDYYNDFVFEFVSSELGSQGSVCAGGRYDNLVGKISNKEVTSHGFGCAIGLERLLLLIKKEKFKQDKIDIFFIAEGFEAKEKALKISESLKDNISKLNILFYLGNESRKKKIKKAIQKKAVFVCILSDIELENRVLLVKSLRYPYKDTNLDWKKIIQFFEKRIIK